MKFLASWILVSVQTFSSYVGWYSTILMWDSALNYLFDLWYRIAFSPEISPLHLVLRNDVHFTWILLQSLDSSTCFLTEVQTRQSDAESPTWKLFSPWMETVFASTYQFWWSKMPIAKLAFLDTETVYSWILCSDANIYWE